VPSDKDFVFVNAAFGNKEGFSQREIKGAEAAKTPCAKLGHPSTKDFNWVIQSNQISECTVTAQDAANDNDN
jgi:hypothetical protein